jgi:3-isopropylmalate/(R)-2-methylmalate dehydratase small subunit
LIKPTMQMEGRAFILGNDIANDGHLMALEFALSRESDPEVLRHQIFKGLDEALADQLTPGDLIVTGRRFAQGNPHIQGFIGLQGARIGLLTESIPSSSYRLAINAGVPLLPSCPGLRAQTTQGDILRVDFETGSVLNVTSGEELNFAPMPVHARTIIMAGGWPPMFKARLTAAKQSSERDHTGQKV